MAVYYVWSGAAGSGTGASWTNAFTTLTTAFATEVAGDTLYVAHDHAESTAAAITLTSSGTNIAVTKVVCVSRAGSVPPVAADRRATATVTTTGNSIMNFAGNAHYDGIIFTAGSGAAGVANIILPSSSGASNRFDNCSLRIGTTGTTSKIFIGGVGTVASGWVEWNNTTVSFAHASQGIGVNGTVKWRNTAAALLGTIPSQVIFSTNACGGDLDCIGVDFSAAGSGKTLVSTFVGTAQKFRFLDCKLDAAVTKCGPITNPGTVEVDLVRSGATGVNYTVSRYRAAGALDQELTIVHSGGASDGTTPIAWKVVTTTNCTWSLPFECPPIAIWNDTVGSPVTVTVEGTGAALPKDDEVWVECQFLGDASSPQASFASDGKADLLATAADQTASSETWGGGTAPFKLSATFTPQMAGLIYCRVKIGKASATYYLDPMAVLS